jgi:hypothetical protein
MMGKAWVAAMLIAAGALAACSVKTSPPRVTASFLTPNYFHLAIAGGNQAHAPALRRQFYVETEAFARANGCTAFQVIKETFLTSANIAPRVSMEPSLLFGAWPVYSGVVECELPSALPVAQSNGAAQ